MLVSYRPLAVRATSRILARGYPQLWRVNVAVGQPERQPSSGCQVPEQKFENPVERSLPPTSERSRRATTAPGRGTARH